MARSNRPRSTTSETTHININPHLFNYRLFSVPLTMLRVLTIAFIWITFSSTIMQNLLLLVFGTAHYGYADRFTIAATNVAELATGDTQSISAPAPHLVSVVDG